MARTHTSAETAEELRQFLMESSPLIEEYTQALCPDCTDVCCRQKHGIYRERDILYLNALGTAIPARDVTRPQDGPCEALGVSGCVHPRWLRPFKCTWYFCEPIIRAMEQSPGRQTRKLTAVMERMIRLYDRMEE